MDRRPVANRGLLAIAALAAVSILLITGAGTTLGGGLHPTSRPRAAHLVMDQQFSSSGAVYSSASLGEEMLSVLQLFNGSYELVLSNAHSNTSRSLGVVPGGSSAYVSGLAAAGGAFFVGVWNFGLGIEHFERISYSGKVHSISLPLSRHTSWTFPYGTASTLYVSAPGLFLLLNPVTRALAGNYSASLPVGVYVMAVLPASKVTYLAGSQATGSSSNPYFGYLNTSTGIITTVSRTIPVVPGVSRMFTSLAMNGVDVDVGGGGLVANSTTFTYGTVDAYLYRYSPGTGSFTNHSALLPGPTQMVWALEPWSHGVLLYAEGYSSTYSGYWVNGGLYNWGQGRTLHNETTLLPATFVGDFLSITSESGGDLFLGGGSSANGLAEVVALRL